MLKLILLLSVSTMMIGCARTTGTVGEDFKPFVKKFEEIYGITVNMGIFYQDLDGWVIGVCRYGRHSREIAIDPEFWDEASDIDREIVIFHELGHCALNQFEHRNYYHSLDPQCPGSIMDEYHIGEVCYEKHYDYYIEELRGW